MKQETVELEDEWEQFEKEMRESGDFFRPEFDVSYIVLVKEAKLEHKAFKEGDVPKWTVSVKFQSVNGGPCDKTWETRSYSVIKKIREHMKKNTLADTKFMLKKKKEGDKTRYVFEEMPG